MNEPLETGWHIAGNGRSVSRGSGFGDWLDPQNIRTISDTATTVSGKGESAYLEATDFGFAIPDEAEIVGVAARFRRRYETTSGFRVATRSTRLTVGGVISGDEKADDDDWPQDFEPYDYGGSADLWGLVLSPEQINSSGFGVVLAAERSDILSGPRIATVWMNVYYVENVGNVFERSNGVYQQGQLHERVGGVFRPGVLAERVGGIWRS